MPGQPKLSAQDSSRIANAGIVAALMVVFIHVDIQPDCPRYVRWVVGMVKAGLCTIAVPLFFMISGYLLGGRVDEPAWWRTAVRKRLFSLGVPYFLWGTLFFCFDYFRSHDFSMSGYLDGLGLTTCETPGLYPLWFVRSLMALVLLSPIVVWMLRRIGNWTLVLLFGFVIVGRFVDGDTSSLVRFLRSVPVVFGGLFFFALGLSWRMNADTILTKKWQTHLILTVGLLLTFAGAFFELNGHPSGKAWFMLLGTPLTTIGFWKWMPSSRWPSWFARSAFPVFLLHVFAIGLYNAVVGREVNNLMTFLFKYSFAVALPMTTVLISKALFPNVVKWAFGGR